MIHFKQQERGSEMLHYIGNKDGSKVGEQITLLLFFSIYLVYFTFVLFIIFIDPNERAIEISPAKLQCVSVGSVDISCKVRKFMW